MHPTEPMMITVKRSGTGRKTYQIPESAARDLEAYIESLPDDAAIPVEWAFPDAFDPILGPAKALRGARYREELTQAQLAAKLGIRQHHLSEMERGKRPISKEMAKRLGEALRMNYKVFL